MDAELSWLSAAVAKLDAAVARLVAGWAIWSRHRSASSSMSPASRGKGWSAVTAKGRPHTFADLIRRARALTTEDLDEMLEPAVDLGRLSEDEAKEVLHSDVVVRGRRREDGSEVYLVVEVSSGVGPGDVERAARTAEILSRSGVAALAVVADKWITADASRRAREMHVWQVTDGTARRPE